MKENEKVYIGSSIQIIQFKEHYHQEIELLLSTIANEFSEPISSKSTNKSILTPDLYLLAIADNKVVGTISITQLSNNNSVLRKMFLHKNYRRIGIAELLLQKVINWGLDNNLKTIYLGTMSQFVTAQKFYEKHKFSKISIEQLPIDFPVNPIDSVFYKQNLIHSIS